MNFDEIRKYWDDRASGDSSAQSTTQDVYLREIEFAVLSERILKYAPRRVADVGCGDGRTTARLANKYPDSDFMGFDYSQSMVANARRDRSSVDRPNLKFDQLDICDGLNGAFNLIYTTRCLINLPSWDLQQLAVNNIHRALAPGGVYAMVENFAEGHANFNQIRTQFNLPEIPVREHNLFFERARLIDWSAKMFEVDEEVNISSAYYLASRVIYSKICVETGVAPNYFDDHHRFAAGLPFCGEYGPVRLLCLKKR